MSRTAIALLAQLVGFAILVLGVYLVAGMGPALIVAGILMVALGR